MTSQSRLGVSQTPLYHVGILFFAWIACNIYAVIFESPVKTTLLNAVNSGLSISIVSASLLLLLYTIYRKGYKYIGLTKPTLTGAWILIYPVFVIVIVLISVSQSGGFHSISLYKWILINTLLAGFSEEVMFRGYIFNALKDRMRFSYSVVIVTVLFGSIHMLNYFTTREWTGSMAQCFLAMLSGLLFLSIRIKTNSILPAIVIHGLFDFAVMSSLSNSVQTPTMFSRVVEVLLVTSPIVFGILGVIQLTRKETVRQFMQTPDR